MHRLNYHLLTIAVMKKLNTMPYERNCEWVLGLDSILDVALTYIAYSKRRYILYHIVLSRVKVKDMRIRLKLKSFVFDS